MNHNSGEGNYRLFQDHDVLGSDVTLNVVDGARLLSLPRHYSAVHHSYRPEFKLPFHSLRRGAGDYLFLEGRRRCFIMQYFI